jgi:putative SOS response-associated peptidase YedK
MAGLFELEGERARFAVLTTAADEAVRRVHDRMPLLLARAQLAAWLAAPREQLLAPAPVDIIGTEVSPRVNSVQNDDPSCLEPAPLPAQLRLFDGSSSAKRV